MAMETRAIYDAAADNWRRNGPVLLSDFTARERVIDTVGDIQGAHLWDLGCGEGYVGRRLAALGASRVDGFDLSESMVKAARHQAGELAADKGGPLHYAVADLVDPAQFPRGPCDGAIAVFLFNYLPLTATGRIFSHVREALRPGGFFLFTVPHPSLAFLRKAEPPFYLDPAGHTYLDSGDVCFEGRIWRRDGTSNPVRSLHKTVEHYFRLLAESGWECMPRVEELGVTQAHLDLDAPFFGPLQGLPLHLLFLLRR